MENQTILTNAQWEYATKQGIEDANTFCTGVPRSLNAFKASCPDVMSKSYTDTDAWNMAHKVYVEAFIEQCEGNTLTQGRTNE